jgi:sulfur-oxidizing protein SoxX
MQKERRRISVKVRTLVFAGLFLLSMVIFAGMVFAGSSVDEGRKICTTRKLGNCVSCHYLPDVESPGNVGPNLVESMKNYTPEDRATVRQWIEDARKFNPETIMPPFGANKILNQKQIDAIVDYLYSLKKGGK